MLWGMQAGEWADLLLTLLESQHQVVKAKAFLSIAFILRRAPLSACCPALAAVAMQASSVHKMAGGAHELPHLPSQSMGPAQAVRAQEEQDEYLKDCASAMLAQLPVFLADVLQQVCAAPMRGGDNRQAANKTSLRFWPPRVGGRPLRTG